MAILMQNIRGTRNAFELEIDLVGTAVEVVSEAVFIPSNVATITFGFTRESGDAGYKIQTTYDTRDSVDLSPSTVRWFDWEVSGVDTNGWLDQDQIQWWLPIPSHIRIAVDGSGSPSDIHYAMRAN